MSGFHFHDKRNTSMRSYLKDHVNFPASLNHSRELADFG